jgi:hypothetical protein
MRNLREVDENNQPGVLPWIERTAEAFLRGERIGFAERDRDEVLCILRAVVELIRERPPRRPCARRRAA